MSAATKADMAKLTTLSNEDFSKALDKALSEVGEFIPDTIQCGHIGHLTVLSLCQRGTSYGLTIMAI